MRRTGGDAVGGSAPERRSGEAGQAMVELTLILVPLLLLMMGAVDLGLAVFYRNMMSNAAREGARFGIVATRTSDQVCAKAMTVLRLPGVVTTPHCGVSGDLEVQVPQRGTTGASAIPVKVTVRYTFRPVTPLVARATGGAIVLEVASTMSIEGPA